MVDSATSVRSWLQRTPWSRQRVQDVVSLLRFDQLPPSHERSPRSASKLKNLVKQLRAHCSPRVQGSQQSGFRISLTVDGEPRTVVPIEEIPALVHKTFRSPLLGAGRGRDALYDKLKRAYIGVSRRRVGEALKHLELKQITTPRPGRVTRPLRPKRPMHWWQMDITVVSFGRPGVNLRYRDILVVLDIFSKYMWTFPLRSHSDAELFAFEREVGDDLLALFLREGPPEILQTDNEFRARHALERLCEDFGVEHRLIAPYYPLSNGAVERANRTVKSMLRAFMKQHSTREWVRALQFVTFAANTTKHSTTGMTPFLLHRGREPPMGRIFRGSLDRAFESGAELPQELAEAVQSDDEAAPTREQQPTVERLQAQRSAGQHAARQRNHEAARRIGRRADAMIARARKMNERVQGREPLNQGDIVRVALERLSKQYRQREKSRLRLHEKQDPYRIRDHYSTDVFVVQAIERRAAAGYEQVQSDDGGGDAYRYRVREAELQDKMGSAEHATAGATLRRYFSRSDLLRIPQDYVLGHGAADSERALCMRGAAGDWCLQDGYFRASRAQRPRPNEQSPERERERESEAPARPVLRPRRPQRENAPPRQRQRRVAQPTSPSLLRKHVCLPYWLWASLDIDHDRSSAPAADTPVCGFVVKVKTMRGGPFYEVYIDEARLCVNIRADLVDQHAVMLNDGLAWPRGERCRTLPERQAD